MALVELLFEFPPPSVRSPVELVFGETGEAPANPDAVLDGHVVLARPTLRGGVQLGVPLAGVVQLERPTLQGGVRYFTDTARPTVGTFGQRFQDGVQIHFSATQRFQDARRLPVGNVQHHQRGRALPAGNVQRFQDAAHVWRGMGMRFQDAGRMARGVASGFQDARRLRDAWGQRFQEGQHRNAGTRMRFQDADRSPRRMLDGRFQEARPLPRPWLSPARDGMRLHLRASSRYQEARVPPPGIWIKPGPQPDDPCYLPSPHLLFAAPWIAGDTHLVFICERHDGPGPEPGATLVIPFLSVYMATHTLTARLLPTNERVHLTDVTLTADADNPHWSLAATGPVHLFDQLRPNGSPRQLQIDVDGIPWVFVVEGISRTRNPGERRVQIRGRSITALLGNPYMPTQTWLNADDMTAQQLVLAALEFTDIDLDWQIADWLVPAGSWSFNGTPMAVAKRVAEAAGAVLQTHPTAGTLQFLPRYPVLPWEWMAPSTVPDVQMPSAAIQTDSLDPRAEPAWDAVYLSGTTNGVLRRVRRAGTAGVLLAPPVTDALMTQDAVARMRGESIIGAGGRGADMSISMQILTGGALPGVLRVNQLLHVDEPAETWRGLVRGVTVRAGDSGVDQSVRVERHE